MEVYSWSESEHQGEEIPHSKHNHSSETAAPSLFQHLMVCQRGWLSKNTAEGTALCWMWGKKSSSCEGQIHVEELY